MSNVPPMHQVWFDLTASMAWQGGITGIIRTELELATQLKKCYPNLKFSMKKEEHFVEVLPHEFPWLNTPLCVTDEYIKFKKARLSQEVSSLPTRLSPRWEPITPLNNIEKFRTAVFLLITTLPKQLHKISLFVYCTGTFLVKKMAWIKRIFRHPTLNNTIHPHPVKNSVTTHPYSPSDIILSVGWMDNQKEALFSKVKEQTPVCLIYAIYDMIPVNKETHFLYEEKFEKRFSQYIEWISINCDFILFGGKTAQKDTQKYFAEKKWRMPPSLPIQWGSMVISETNEITAAHQKDILTSLNITGPFIIMVATLENRKNHIVLYKAYTKLIEQGTPNLPQLIFIGKSVDENSDLIYMLKRDPFIKNKLLLISPTDAQLDLLYRNCLFAVLPTLYEGWSLTLPEALGYGKFCLSSDIAPLREIAGDLVEYVDPWDVSQWAEKLAFYSQHLEILREKELRIQKEWKRITWEDAAKQIMQVFPLLAPTSSAKQSKVWCDLTTSYLLWEGNVTGVIRAELMLAKYLHTQYPYMSFFAFYDGHFFEIDKSHLDWLFNSEDINVGYKTFKGWWQEREGVLCRVPREIYNHKYHFAAPVLEVLKDAMVFHPSKMIRLRYAYLLLCSFLPSSLQSILTKVPRFLRRSKEEQPAKEPNVLPEVKFPVAFKSGDIVFSAGLDWSLQSLKAISQTKTQIDFKFCHVIYDYTPIKIPHLQITPRELYAEFLYWVNQTSDLILYGGKTAQKDGVAFQKENNWPVIKSAPIKFGMDIFSTRKNAQDQEILRALNIQGRFIMTVCTLEIRKNHETLYKAYIRLLEKNIDNCPQLLFIGKQGWKTADFFNSIVRDERIKNKLIILSPTDEQLDVLYRNCEFTLLASVYEGWSLTVPESLAYGKFCLCSDVEPLREVGGDLVDYIYPWDIMEWSRKMAFYLTHPDVLKEKEARIKKEWKSLSWQESAKMVSKELSTLVTE